MMKEKQELSPALTDLIERGEKAALWEERFAKLLAKRGMTLTAFCDKYNLNRYVLSRHINGHATPHKAIFKKVEKGLQKEGV